MRIVEFVQRGVSLEGLPQDVGSDAESLTRLMVDRVIDARLALGMFEAESAARLQGMERDAEQRAYRAWEDEIREQARRDVLRARWAAGELPQGYQRRLPMLHARSFVLALAQVFRALRVLARLDTGATKPQIAAVRDELEALLPSLVDLRDSIEHAEDRVRSLGKYERPLTLQPVSNQLIDAPGGGVLVADSLNGRCYGGTVADGNYAEVEVSDATIETVRSGVQRVLDALPWREDGHGTPHYIPYS